MSKPGRVLARLTAEEARARPDWVMRANATESQKRKWRRHMMEWSIDRLNEKQVADENRVNTDPEAMKTLLASMKPSLDWSAAHAAIEAARHGNTTAALRDLHLRLSKFFEKPKRRRGEYPRQKDTLSAAARWAARCLREEIWPEHFGKKSRRKEDGLTAEDIAAEWGLRGLGDEWLPGDVAERLKADEAAKIKWKPAGKHKRPRRKPRAKIARMAR
jgi:hypothetical protein